MSDDIERLKSENTCLRGLVAKLVRPCHYCGLDDMAKCRSGFPGCSLADDLMCGDDAMGRRLLATVRDAENGLAANHAKIKALIAKVNEMQDELARMKGQ